MGWYKNRAGNRVHGEGSFAAALTRRGFSPCDEPDDTTVDAPEHGVSFEVDTRTHAELTEAERANVDTAVRDEAADYVTGRRDLRD